MMINAAVLHIFDFNTNVCIVSQKALDFSSDVVYEYVNKRLSRIVGDASQTNGASSMPPVPFSQSYRPSLTAR